MKNKFALKPFTKGKDWIKAAKTDKLAKSSAEDELRESSNVTTNLSTTSVNQSNTAKKALKPSTKGEDWIKAANSGKFAKSATDNELRQNSDVTINLSTTSVNQYDTVKQALRPSKGLTKQVVNNKGRLKMAQSMSGSKQMKGKVALKPKVGNLINNEKDNTVPKTPTMFDNKSSKNDNKSSKNDKNKTDSDKNVQNVINKITGDNSKKNVSKKNISKKKIVKTKSNDNYTINMNKNLQQSFLDYDMDNKIFKNNNKKFGL